MNEVGLDCKMMVPKAASKKRLSHRRGAESVKRSLLCTFPGLPAQQLTGPGKEFYERYKKKYNAEPEPYAIYGYECGKVALEAIKKAGKKDRAAIVAACLGMKDFEGALGKWSFDANVIQHLQRSVVLRFEMVNLNSSPCSKPERVQNSKAIAPQIPAKLSFGRAISCLLAKLVQNWESLLSNSQLRSTHASVCRHIPERRAVSAPNRIDGIAYGSLIALIALGYSMFMDHRLINFAHGDVFMLGAFLTGSILFGMSRNELLPTTDSYFLVGVSVIGLDDLSWCDVR